MVKNNQQIGNVKGITIIELGDGDTFVSYVHNRKENYTGVLFHNDIKKDIGSEDQVSIGATTDEFTPDAMITFTEIESIEVLERALKKAKTMLKQIKSEGTLI